MVLPFSNGMGGGGKSRDAADRRKVVDAIRREMAEHHIDGLEGVAPFHKLLDEYAQPEILSGLSGRLYVEELERYIEYVLPLRASSKYMVRLVVAPHVKRRELKEQHARCPVITHGVQ